MAQEIINTGATANDGTGDPLRTAFIKTDNNFDQIWAAGPVGSNVRISGNTITTLQVNQDLVLAPNGAANIRLNNNTIPGANNTWYLGSATNRWRGVYVGAAGLDVTGNITAAYVTANNDLTVNGNLIVDGDVIQIGNIITDAKTIQLANTAATDAQANGSGITVGASDDVATLLYNSTNNEWRMNIGANISGNVSANYFVGNGSLLTGIATSYGNANVADFLPTYGGNLLANTVEFTGELLVARRIVVGTLPSGNIEIVDDTSGNGPALKTPGGSGLDLLIEPSGNLYLTADGGEVIVTDQTPSVNSATGALRIFGGIGVNGNVNAGENIAAVGNITANYFVGNGSLLTGIATSYGNANVADYLPTYTGDITANNITISTTIRVGTLGSGNLEIVGDSQGLGPAIKTPGGSGLDMVIEPSGNLYLNADGGEVIVSDQTPSVDANSGALKVLGGIGVNGNINAGGNIAAAGWTGNLIPAANAVYSLGNATNYWSNLWVANNTIFIGGVALGITGNTLTVGGEPVLSNDSDASISTTGSITAETLSANSGVDIGVASLLFDTDTNDLVFETVPPGGFRPSNDDLYNLGNVSHRWSNLYVYNISAVSEIEVGGNVLVDLDVSATRDISAGGNITANAILTDNYLYANGEPFVSASTGNIAITGTDITIAAGASETQINISPDPEGDAFIQIPNNDTANTANLRVVNETGNVTVETNNGTNIWTFGIDANLTLPNGGAIIFEDGDGFIGKDGDDLLISWDDEELVLRSENGDVQVEADDDVEIRSGYNFGTGVYGGRWIFNNNGELQGIPQDTANSAEYNGGYIQFVGNSSGDGNGYTTLQLIPDETRVANDQYLIIDPTQPAHIHIRAGGTQDDSNAELYLGGERNFVRVTDNGGVRLQNQTRDDTEYNYSDPSTFTSGTWYESAGTYFVQYTTTDAELIDITFDFNQDDENTLLVYYNGGANTAELTSAGSISNLGGNVYRVSVNETPPTNPTAISAFDYTIWTVINNRIELESNDFEVAVEDDVIIIGGDEFSLRNRSPSDPIEIVTNSNDVSQTWEFGADGTLETPGDIIVSGDITGTAGASTLVLAAEPDSNTAIQLNDTVDSEIRTVANLAIRTDSSDTDQTWQFDVNGTLTLPEGATISNFVDQNITIGAAEINLDPTAFGASTIQMLPVTRTTEDKGYNLEVLAGGVNSSGTEPGDLYLRGGVSFINGVDGGNAYITGGSGGLGASSGNVEIRTSTDTDNYAWSFDNAGNLTIPGNVIMVGKLTGTGASPAPSISDFQSASFFGNVTGGNLIASTTIYGNVDIVLGNIANASATKTRITSFGANSYIQTGNGTAGSTGNIVFAPYLDSTEKVVIDTASGNVTAQNFTGNISITGNVTGTSANVDLVAGAYEWSFDNTGNLTLPGNTFAVNYANNTPVDVVTRFQGTWAVPTGNSTQSFTVDAGDTYYLWVEGNIPNGIIAWNATATITNTNVPVVGAQYAWVYDGAGTPIDFTSIPNQFVGTANTIVRSNVSPSVTTNRFDFGINNTSGSERTVRYGWIRIS